MESKATGEEFDRVDHRGSGWTLWREVYGTFIGVLPLILAIAAGAITIIRDNDRHELEIVHLKGADARHEAQLQVLRADQDKTRTEIITALHELLNKVESLQMQVAKFGPR